jgi:hypothetical protein
MSEVERGSGVGPCLSPVRIALSSSEAPLVVVILGEQGLGPRHTAAPL